MNDRPMSPQPSPFAAAVKTYRPPVPLAPTDLRLSGNEGSLLMADWLDVLADLAPHAVSRYPSVAELEGDIARAFGLQRQQVLAGTGGDDAVERTIRAYLCPGREIILNEPSFVMLQRYATLAGGDSVFVPWLAGRLPVDEMLAAVTERTAIIVVVSPNNPTGLVATVEDLRRLRREAPSVLLVVDLAYGEFADDDLTDAALSLPNTVVIRSFSKAWGLAGLRVGWAAGPADVIEHLRAVGHPYPVSSLSMAIVSHMLQHGREDVETFVGQVRASRRTLSQALDRGGGEVTPSQGNFVLVRFDNAVWVRDALAGMGIAVRAFPEVPVLHDRLRITVPGEQPVLGRLCEALETVLRPEAILLAAELAGHQETVRPACKGLALGVVAGPTADDIRRTRSQLGVERAWMLTASAETTGAARQAGVLPVAVSTGDGLSETDLLTAGAAKVLSDVAQIKELLP